MVVVFCFFSISPLFYGKGLVRVWVFCRRPAAGDNGANEKQTIINVEGVMCEVAKCRGRVVRLSVQTNGSMPDCIVCAEIFFSLLR